ncbi:NusA-like transcription termination signal-binding factor [Saccharolobus solfataricus]|uniref:Probable transcription termination protein NusA n=2 Tax=Saccharolobus solfataricus TaxID=2287 RepID=A0A0E3K0F1_SACSO|nr:NusA-like transcription termination signal-binding factor [Saccharolobus solfataricus]AKA73545.1 NusA-like transcription termination signal-binding factor [Saccharolobus solfataricus]AKA76243.1 NusA-like transcription termination signal-binding factor [Saccharolobus solfataricus]AKA78935.1 NusA-like transcription termination signal-binding factor [Saccharolobus solfataricus]AZF68013.1 NusA-like transcription termination signal-binding factor [Saccharolobus solfataricus]AZF70633.1 NusA-like 
MPEIRLTPEEIRYISLFQEVTRANVRDCIIDNENNRIIFLVDSKDMGVAIGKSGINVKKLKKIIGKDIELVAYSDNLEELVKNLMSPARVRSVKVVNTSSKKSVYINIDPQDKGLAIGKNGRNVARAKLILKRYMDIDNVVIV